MKICIPVSHGGHLTQALILAEKLKKHHIVFVTTRYGESRVSKSKGKFKSVINPHTNPFLLMILAFQALWILLMTNPDVIISTGSNIPVPFFILGKLLGKKLIYIESWSRVKRPSKSGKLLYSLSDLFFVQWEDLKKEYPKAIYAGRLI